LRRDSVEQPNKGNDIRNAFEEAPNVKGIMEMEQKEMGTYTYLQKQGTYRRQHTSANFLV
jgi:hypothetical protein